MELALERRTEQNQTAEVLGGAAAICPPVNEDYWAYRVRLSETQAVLGFPKYSTVGIGFAVEEDWNTNLPFTCDTTQIFEHIRHNKGDDSIEDDAVVAAIRLIREAVAADRLGSVEWRTTETGWRVSTDGEWATAYAEGEGPGDCPVCPSTDPHAHRLGRDERVITEHAAPLPAAARADGAAPLHDGDPGWNPDLDGDGDGVACE